MDNSKQSSAKRIQEIFNDTVQKIIRIIQPQDADQQLKIGSEITPILQSFLMNIQIYHSQVFNGIINGIALQIPNQSLVPDNLGGEPDVIPRFGGEPDLDNLVVTENALAGFAKLDIDDTRPILESNTKTKPNYSIGSSSNGNGFRDKSQNAYNYYKTSKYLDSRQNIHSQTNYDDFIKTYTDAYSRYHNTYVVDSSEGEDEEEHWKSLNEYISEQSNQTENLNGTNSCLSDTQCCARLSKFMKYKIIDFPENFLDAYPPDTYIEGGYVFGKPCSRKIRNTSLEKGLFLCDEHINEPSVEDIREPRHHTIDSPQFNNDDTDIVFSKYNQFGNYGTGNTEFDAQYLDSNVVNDGTVDAFADGHQCCARLNKYRVYRLENESDKFLDIYPPDVYIADGCVFGTACPNLISDESFQSGIRFCIHHQSDPYVENICEPRTTHTNLHKTLNESISDLGLTEHTFNKSSGKSPSSQDKYDWDKYNSDFDYLC